MITVAVSLSQMICSRLWLADARRMLLLSKVRERRQRLRHKGRSSVAHCSIKVDLLRERWLVGLRMHCERLQRGSRRSFRQRPRKKLGCRGHPLHHIGVRSARSSRSSTHTVWIVLCVGRQRRYMGSTRWLRLWHVGWHCSGQPTDRPQHTGHGRLQSGIASLQLARA